MIFSAIFDYLALFRSKQRTDDYASVYLVERTSLGNSRKPLDTASAREIEYLGLKIVVGVVSGSEDFDSALAHKASEEGVSLVSRLGLKALAGVLCKSGDVHALNAELNAE